MNSYPKAIEILFDEKTDFKILCYEIAKSNPTVVVRAFERLNPTIFTVTGPTEAMKMAAESLISQEAYLNASWKAQCYELMVRGEKIAAIRLCRELTGKGLKEAKDAVERL